ncbi:hypothetical protein VTJ04DRAFT_2719 [Mycothermus thermophilus]|uniref:uncharacterized protein n=1 Tax=Humicola insolens TaxID=85995 RepID=UPI003741F02B
MQKKVTGIQEFQPKMTRAKEHYTRGEPTQCGETQHRRMVSRPHLRARTGARLPTTDANWPDSPLTWILRPRNRTPTWYQIEQQPPQPNIGREERK